MIATLIVLHAASSALILLHAIAQLALTFSYLRKWSPPRPPPLSDLPFVTVQLPVYNEKYVVADLIDRVVRLDYPEGRWEIDVVDDSDDETVRIVEERVSAHRANGVAIRHLRRARREGFKGGALRDALDQARGEWIAIFDADFEPPADFLLRVAPFFAEPGVAAVQTRWGHANASQSLLTRVQAFLLDAHFFIEQCGRAAAGCFINFNGTGGVWRVRAIRDAGGWSGDTLTEDLDLSYRAQLGGWRIVYLPDVVCDATLPRDVNSFARQQRRWMQGVAQNAVRLLPKIFAAKLPLRVRVHAAAHLLESTMYVPVLVVPLLTAILANCSGVPAWVFAHPLLLAAAAMLAGVYFVATRASEGGAFSLLRFAGTWIAFSFVTFGMSLNATAGVAAAYAGRRGTFVRTPKTGRSRSNDYAAPRLPPVSWAELACCVLLSGASVTAALNHGITRTILPLIAATGLAWVVANRLRRG